MIDLASTESSGVETQFDYIVTFKTASYGRFSFLTMNS